MECTRLCNTQSDMEIQSNYREYSRKTLMNINLLTERLLVLLADNTLEFQARGLAWYIITIKQISLEAFSEKINKYPKKVLVYLGKLMSCQSEFATFMPLSIGIDHISSLASGKMQKSLDVKHLKSAHKPTLSIHQDLIVPDIKPHILYSNPNFLWIRVFCDTQTIQQCIAELQYIYKQQTTFTFVEINPNVCELYIRKNKQLLATLPSFIDNIFAYLETKMDIIFCSELILFKFNTQLFISNFLKFMFCYSQSKDVFELDSSEDFVAFNHYVLNCCLFLHTKNLANMSDETHSPLNNYTAERPSVLLNKNKGSQIHVVEGNRPLLSTDKHSDLGTTSTRIEVVHAVELNDSTLMNIV